MDPHDPAGRAGRRPGSRRPPAARARVDVPSTTALLDRALTHRSYCAEHGIEASNERLEFLGDSVLGFVVTTFVYDEYPAAPRGRARQVARRGRERGDARRARRRHRPRRARCASARARTRPAAAPKPSILADAMEAVIAAVYLDGGLDAARARDPRGARGARSASRPPVPAAATTRRACRSSRRSSVDQLPALPGPPRGPRPLQALLRHGAARAASVYGDGRGSFEEGGRAGRGTRTRGNGCSEVSRDSATGGGWAMPELPEVEVVRRDLEREVVGKKIKSGRSRRHAQRAPSPQPQAVREPARRQEDHRRRTAREVPPAAASTVTTCS